MLCYFFLFDKTTLYDATHINQCTRFLLESTQTTSGLPLKALTSSTSPGECSTEVAADAHEHFVQAAEVRSQVLDYSCVNDQCKNNCQRYNIFCLVTGCTIRDFVCVLKYVFCFLLVLYCTVLMFPLLVLYNSP